MVCLGDIWVNTLYKGDKNKDNNNNNNIPSTRTWIPHISVVSIRSTTFKVKDIALRPYSVFMWIPGFEQVCIISVYNANRVGFCRRRLISVKFQLAPLLQVSLSLLRSTHVVFVLRGVYILSTFSDSFLITFLPPESSICINRHVSCSSSRIIISCIWLGDGSLNFHLLIPQFSCSPSWLVLILARVYTLFLLCFYPLFLAYVKA